MGSVSVSVSLSSSVVVSRAVSVITDVLSLISDVFSLDSTSDSLRDVVSFVSVVISDELSNTVVVLSDSRILSDDSLPARCVCSLTVSVIAEDEVSELSFSISLAAVQATITAAQRKAMALIAMSKMGRLLVIVTSFLLYM